MKERYFHKTIIIFALLSVVQGFSFLPYSSRTQRLRFPSYSSTSNIHQNNYQNQNHPRTRVPHNLFNTLMDEFSTADGEIVNPYKILKVSRTADRQEIRQAYLRLSKKYHPDAVAQTIKNSGILPGKCNSVQETRLEWERVKLSYEILSDRRMRLKYDRLDVVTDPGAAFRRAALNTVAWGFMGVGKGIISMSGLVREKSKDDPQKLSTAEFKESPKKLDLNSLVFLVGVGTYILSGYNSFV
jgi:hypothetical protein